MLRHGVKRTLLASCLLSAAFSVQADSFQRIASFPVAKNLGSFILWKRRRLLKSSLQLLMVTR